MAFRPSVRRPVCDDRLDRVDLRNDPQAWANALGISKESTELCVDSEIIDLHVDSFIWTRVFGYDLCRRHGRGLLGARYFHQADLPRLEAAGVTGAVWSITTNPLNNADERVDVLRHNLAQLSSTLEGSGRATIARTRSEYLAARSAGKHAAFVGLQGGNAIDRDAYAIDALPDGLVVRVTLLHLTNSSLGTTSSPLAGSHDDGLTNRGRDLVRALNARRIFVDLAHVSRRGFWDAVETSDPAQPLLVSHTGVSGVFPHWRNIDDNQLRAVADRGGTVGIMFQAHFLGLAPVHAQHVVDHLEHIVKTAGEDHASIGSDWDGWIVPPRDLTTCVQLPRLVDLMLRRGWSPARIKKILADNFLRCLSMLRPEPSPPPSL